IQFLIEDGVGKPVQGADTDCSGLRGVHLGVLTDSSQCRLQFRAKIISQTDMQALVAVCRILSFLRRVGMEIDWLHRRVLGMPLRTSSAGMPTTRPARTSAMRSDARASHSALDSSSSGSSDRSRYCASSARSVTGRLVRVVLSCSKDGLMP